MSIPQSEKSELLSPEAAAAYLGGDRPLKIATLADWRHKGIGPNAVRIGRLIRYRRTDLDAWMAGRVQQGR